MTDRDDALLAPSAVRLVERRAQQVWLVSVGGAAVLLAVLALLLGPSCALSALVLSLWALVASGWAWLRSARTLRAASERTREVTGGRRSTVTRWSRAVRDGRFAEVEPDEAPALVRWAEAAVVHARLSPYGLGGFWVAFVMLQVTNLALNPFPFADGTPARLLVVALLVGLFGTAFSLHRRDRNRLEQFLDGLDPPGHRL